MIIKDIPKGHSWVFITCGKDQRMCLQKIPLYSKIKVWLEDSHGRRIFKPEGKILAKVLKAIQAKVTADHRKIESEWVRVMIGKGWLKLKLEGRGVRRKAILIAYPDSDHSFKRTIELSEWGPPETYATRHDVKLDIENAALILDAQRSEDRQIYLSLPKILWVE